MRHGHDPKRRALTRAALSAAAVGAVGHPGMARAQATWPSRPVRFVVSFPAGGLTDLYVRAYGDYFGQQFGAPVVVENRAGGAGLIGSDHVAKSAPDGHTFLFTITSSVVTAQALFRKLPYQPDRDFTWLSAMSAGPLVCAVHRDVPVKTSRDLVELARAKSLNFGSFAQGSTAHMIAHQMNKLYGTRFEIVHYKGEAPMWQDLLAGRIETAIGSFAAAGAHVKAGTAHAVAVTGPVRSPGLPDVPTFIEQGLDAPVFRLRGWIGMLAPAGLPPDIVERVAKLVADGAETPRMRQLYTQFGIAEKPTSPEEFARMNREESPVWIAIARELGVTLD